MRTTEVLGTRTWRKGAWMKMRRRMFKSAARKESKRKKQLDNRFLFQRKETAEDLGTRTWRKDTWKKRRMFYSTARKESE